MRESVRVEKPEAAQQKAERRPEEAGETFDPADGLMARMASPASGAAATPGAHAALLQRTAALQAGRAVHPLLHLQRRYGNRHVQRVVALARQAVGQAEGGALDPEVESSIQRARGGGQALDGATREHMESAFGTDFGGVRIHTGGEADRLNQAVSARAFTTGSDVFFRQGEYSPGSSSGRELLAHELTHVVQQGGSASLQAKLTLGPVDDPAEREADEVARSVVQRSAASAAQQRGAGGVLRRKPAAEARKEYKIRIPRGITTSRQLLRYVEVRIFGRVVHLAWDLSKSEAAREPARNVGKTLPFRPTLEALELYGVSPAAPGETAEAEAAYKGLDPAEKEAINTEIDQRYYESMGIYPGSKIQPGETGRAVVWNSLKQQVLADRKKLAQLPDTVKALLGPANFSPQHYKILVEIGEALSQLSADELQAFFTSGPQGAVITSDDYPLLLTIARKLAALSPEAREDYLGRVSASTASLADLERAIDRYLQLRAEREQQLEEHETAAEPLLGAEDVYTLYRNYKHLKKNVALSKAAKGSARDKATAEEAYEILSSRLKETEAALLAALQHKGFDSIDAFAAALESYRLAFRTQAVHLALDVLDRYEHMLFEERKKLERGGAAAIAQGIAGSKASEHYKEYHRQKDIVTYSAALRDPYDESSMMEVTIEAGRAADAAKKSAESEVIRGSGSPLLAERNVDLEKLAGLDAAGTQVYLSELIEERSAKVRQARQEFKDDPDRVFTLQELVDATRTVLGIDPATVYGQSIQDYVEEEAKGLKLSEVALGILALALVFLVPGGGWLAAAALVGQAGISTYQAFTAYKEYQQQQRDYELGFLATEPSLLWVGIAVAAAAIDIGVPVGVLLKESAAALKTLKSPLLELAKDGRKLPELLTKIDEAQGLHPIFKAALRREAQKAAATDARAAWKELFRLTSRAHGFAGAFVDPELVVQLFRALYQSIRHGVTTLARLSAEAKVLEITGDIASLSAAERAQLQAAFDEAKQLARIGQSRKMDEGTLLEYVDRWALNRGRPGFQTKLLDEMRAWKPLTPEQKKALQDVVEQRELITGLFEEKSEALQRLLQLRRQKSLTPKETAEIRSLERQIEELDPEALAQRDRNIYGKQEKKPPGEIERAQNRLKELEEAAARAKLSLYDRLRAATPSGKARDRALRGATVDQVGPLKSPPTPLEADHIVPVREVADMDGFADLPWKDQKEIVDMKENLIAMDGSANRSKLDRPWRSWPQASDYYGRSTIEAMVKREAEVRTLIQEEIKKRLADLAAGKP
jgi:hypothetical protein